MKNFIERLIFRSASIVCQSMADNAAGAVVVVMLFYFGFSAIEAQIETLIFGDRFIHFLDPIFSVLFMAYSGVVVYVCAARNAKDK